MIKVPYLLLYTVAGMTNQTRRLLKFNSQRVQTCSTFLLSNDDTTRMQMVII